MPLAERLDSVKTEKAGHIKSSFETGSVFLEEDKSGKTYRINWDGNMKPVMVPTGKYRLKGYRIERAHKGKLWFLSATSSKGTGKQFEVEEGKETRLDISSDARVELKNKLEGDKLSISFRILGHNSLGLSVISEDVKKPPVWKLVSAGKLSDTGTFRFG